MRRANMHTLEERQLDKGSRFYAVRCGDYKKRKVEHRVEFLKNGIVVFHGHAQCTSPKALMQEYDLQNLGESRQGCSYLAQLILQVTNSSNYANAGGRGRRTSEMVYAEKMGLPTSIYLELMLIADRRRPYKFLHVPQGKSAGWEGPMGPLEKTIGKRLEYSLTAARERLMVKLRLVYVRLRAKGVTTEDRYYYV